MTTQDADRILTEVEQVNAAFLTLDTMNEGEWPYPDHRSVASWDRERLRILVKSLKHTNAMPLLLSLTELAPKVFVEAVACIERFVFRYKTVVNAHVGPMTKVYLKHAKAIRDSGTCDIKGLRADLSKLINRYASDSIFEPAIREMKFSPKSGRTPIYVTSLLQLKTTLNGMSWVLREVPNAGTKRVPSTSEELLLSMFTRRTLPWTIRTASWK